MIRLRCKDGARFHHDGIDVGRHWAEFDVDSFNAKQRACLKAFRGRTIDVHPEDVAKLDGAQAPAASVPAPPAASVPAEEPPDAGLPAKPKGKKAKR